MAQLTESIKDKEGTLKKLEEEMGILEEQVRKAQERLTAIVDTSKNLQRVVASTQRSIGSLGACVDEQLKYGENSSGPGPSGSRAKKSQLQGHEKGGGSGTGTEMCSGDGSP